MGTTGGSRLALAVALVVTAALSAFVLGVLAALVGLHSTATTGAFALRTLLSSLAVVLVARWGAAQAARRGLRHPIAFAGSAVLAAYPLDPWAWSGRAGFGQFWFTPGPVTVLVDAVLWAGVAAIGAGWGVATAEAAPGTGDDARRPSYG